MLGGPCLSPCSQHWREGSAVRCILSAHDKVVVGLDEGDTLLFEQHDLAAPVSEFPGGPQHCAAAACGPDGSVLLLAHGGQLQRVELPGGQRPSSEPVELAGGQPAAAVASIACQEQAPIFGVARGSYVHIIGASGEQDRCIGPLPAPVEQLAWAGDTLIAATPAALLTWLHSGTQEGPSLPSPGVASAFLSIAASTAAPYLVASCADNEVLGWELAALQAAPPGAAAPTDGGAPTLQPSLQLADFESPVQQLAWDPTGRFLATADGPDCSIWDLSHASGADRAASTACCGHDSRTAITALAFQPDGALLATGGSSGQVALFDCAQFRRGGVLAPVAATRLPPAPAAQPSAAASAPPVTTAGGAAVTALLWLPGGRLAVGDAAGRLTCMQLAAAGGVSPLSPAPPLAVLQQEAALVANNLASGLARVHIGGAGSGAHAEAEEEQEGDIHVPAMPPPGGNPPSHATEVAAAVQLGADEDLGEALPMALPTALPAIGAGDSGSAAAEYAEHDATDDDAAAATMVGNTTFPGPALPPLRQLSTGAPGSSSGNGNGAAAPSRRARGARGRGGNGNGGNGNGNGGGSGGSDGGNMQGMSGHGGFSPALMHHIQAIRENPPGLGAQRGDQPQLAGWGLGSPSGPAVPWMLVGPGGTPSMVPPPPPGGHAVQGAVQGGTAHYQHYQGQTSAMMQRMGAQQMNSPMGMQGCIPAPSSPAMPGGGAMPPAPYSPHAVYGGMGTTAGMAPHQQMMAATWAPYMAQVQQWAGTAPGYMMYQHPQYMAVQQVQTVRLSGGSQGGFAHAAAHGGGGSHGSGGAGGSTQYYQGGGGSQGNSGRMSPMGSSVDAFSPQNSGALVGGGGGAAPYRRMDSAGSSVNGGSRQASFQAAALDAASDVAARNDARENNQACSPRAGQPAPAAAQPPAAAGAPPGSLHSSPPTLQTGVAPASPSQRSELSGASSRRFARGGEEAGGSADGTAGASSTAGATSGSVAVSGTAGASPDLLGSSSVDLNNAEINNHALSSSEETGSQFDVDGGVGGDPVCTIYVGNLPGTVDEYMLMCAFAPFGPVTHVQVIKEKGSNLSRGYGFVSYAHPIYATVAMQQMNQQVLFGPFAGQRIKVAPSKRH